MDEYDILSETVKELRDEMRLVKERVTRLERFQWMFIGAVGVIVILFIPLFLDIYGP